MNRKCPRCGHILQDGDKFCIHCGYKLSDDDTSQSRASEKISDDIGQHHKKITKMKVLEPMSTSHQSNREVTTKPNLKVILGWVLVIVTIISIIAHHNTLPQGLSKPSEVMNYCMRRNKYINWAQKESEVGTEATEYYGLDEGVNEQLNSDRHNYELLKNKETGRFVFRYKYKNKVLPSYLIMSPAGNPKYCILIITPVKKGNIAGIVAYGRKTKEVRSQYEYSKYYGYSSDDLADKGIKLDKGIKEKNYDNFDVYYDTNY